jgi:hypothetical protein
MRVLLAVALALAPLAADAAPRARTVAKSIGAPITDAVQTTVRRIDLARARLSAQKQTGPATRMRAKECREHAIGAREASGTRMSLYRACLVQG